MWVKLCIFSLSVLEVFSSNQLPPDIKKCSSKDTACLKVAIEDSLPKLANGIKELGVPGLDPIRIPNFSVSAGAAVQLTQNYKNIEFLGLKATKLTSLSVDLDKGKISIGAICPHNEFKGSYNIKGRLLLLEVYGEGPFSAKYEKMKMKIDMDVEKYSKNGDTYLKVTKFTMDAEPERAYYQFDNLFDGNKLLGDNINRVLNDNWKQLFDDVIKDYLVVASQYLMALTNRLFQKVPLKDIFLD
ncbi:protein takeout-like isoform X2 [Coccinella septempunctata]|uniref:protein takeout-like isoform X2 n=1 Tax=Coccinella septempunctata TaxID=41139 RepID=UPI001D05F6B8|nr:protein takeout-like isoform X2 [Coccinella septempunctata]